MIILRPHWSFGTLIKSLNVLIKSFYWFVYRLCPKLYYLWSKYRFNLLYLGKVLHTDFQLMNGTLVSEKSKLLLESIVI